MKNRKSFQSEKLFLYLLLVCDYWPDQQFCQKFHATKLSVFHGLVKSCDDFVTRRGYMSLWTRQELSSLRGVQTWYPSPSLPRAMDWFILYYYLCFQENNKSFSWGKLPNKWSDNYQMGKKPGAAPMGSRFQRQWRETISRSLVFSHLLGKNSWLFWIYFLLKTKNDRKRIFLKKNLKE